MVGQPLVEPRQFDEDPGLVSQVLDFTGQGTGFDRDFEHVR